MPAPKAAEKYQVKNLFELSIHYFEDNLTVFNVLEILVASVLVDCQPLYNKASRFAIRNNGRLVKSGPKWIEFKNTHPSIVMAILEDLI